MYNKFVLLDMPHFLPHGKCHISPGLEREIKGQNCYFFKQNYKLREKNFHENYYGKTRHCAKKVVVN